MKMAPLICIAALVLFLFSLTPYLPFPGKAFDLPSHFVLQYLIGALLLLPLVYLLRAPAAVYAVLAVVACLNLWQLKPFFALSQATARAELKILQANVLVLNGGTSKLRSLIDVEKPDVVLVSEVNSAFARMFRDIAGDYPYQDVFSSDDSAYGIAVLSRRPLETVQKKSFADDRIPAQIIKIRVADKIVDIVSLHTANPVGSLTLRDREFEALAEWFGDARPVYAVVAGDFNATPWCYAYKQLIRKTGLKNARAGRGLIGSWPSWVPGFLRIPIDHTLVTDNIGIAEHRTADVIGSDHLPVVTALSFH